MNVASRQGILMVQLGARDHYLVPLALDHLGMLAELATDFYYDTRLDHSSVRALAARFSAVAKAKARYSAKLPFEKVRAIAPFGIAAGALTRVVPYRYQLGLHLVLSQVFGHLVLCGASTARHSAVFGYNSEMLEILRWTRAHALKGVVQQVSLPKQLERRLVDPEYDLWPGWQKVQVSHFTTQYADREQREWDLADLIISPSAFVASGLQKEGVPIAKVVVVPYGLASEWFYASETRRRQPNKLRVLFAGSVSLHKGIQYLYQAASILNSDQFEFSAVGSVLLSAHGRRTVSEKVRLWGPVPRPRMGDVYRSADVLVLPSLSEGYAWVVHEAMATGLPVITTENARSIVRDGVDGFVVPIRDPNAISQRLQTLAENMELCQQMGQNALERATGFGSFASYVSRLSAVLDHPAGQYAMDCHQTGIAHG